MDDCCELCGGELFDPDEDEVVDSICEECEDLIWE